MQDNRQGTLTTASRVGSIGRWARIFARWPGKKKFFKILTGCVELYTRGIGFWYRVLEFWPRRFEIWTC